ncbi:MAG: nucleotidyltransferase domain-containing protein [Nanoarchaeota archaeon]
MINKNEITAYAIDFVSYLISKESEINRVILHGSIARGDFNEESDIDLFIDVLKTDKKIEKKIDNILNQYYKTKKIKEWELKGIKNTFSLIVGSLDNTEWKDLKRSIMNTGIILYGKYKGEAEKIKQYTLFSFENIKPNAKRVAVFRKLFGFKLKNKIYPGIIEKYKGIQVGKGAVLIPIENTNALKLYFQGKRIPVKMYDLWSD